MKNKGLLVVVSVLVIAGLLIGGFGCKAPSTAPTSAPTSAPAKPIELVFAYTWADSSSFSLAHAWMMEQLTERTDGQVTVSFLPRDTLGGASEMLHVVATGGADFTQLSPAYTPAEFPIWNALVMQIFQTHREANWIANQMEVAIPETAAILQEEHAAQNIKVLLQPSAESDYYFTTKEAVTKLEDLEGMKSRSFGKWAPALYEKLGVIPVTVMTAELYDALSKGVVDANCMPIVIGALYKTHEVVNHISFGTGVSSAYGVLAINLDTWNSLPADVQKILEDLRWETLEFEENLTDELIEEYSPLYVFDDISQQEQDYLYSLWGEILDEQWMKEMVDSGNGDNAEVFIKVLKEQQALYRK